jgi:hypothetical protein
MVQRELIGPYQLLKAGQVDLNAGTITLPLHEGHVKVNNESGSGAIKKVWYILTDIAILFKPSIITIMN